MIKSNNISYLNCKWYMGDGKCKMPSVKGGFSECISIEKLDPFCEWLVDFLNKIDNIDTNVELPESFKLEYSDNSNVINDFMQILSCLF